MNQFETFQSDPLTQQAEALWLEYFVIAEEYDRALQPGAWSPHEPESWIPLDMASSRRNAARLLAQLRTKAREAGIPAETIEEAKRRIGAWSYTRQREFWLALG